jgi:hypothetical protein
LELETLLPQPGATNVPLNAVLITSSNRTVARMDLREVVDAASAGADAAAGLDVDAGADAGAPGAVPIDIECHVAPGQGAVCLGRPLEPLKANTRYEWRGQPVDNQSWVPFEYDPGEWRSFTTGSERDDEPIDARDVTIRVVREERSLNSCGISHSIHVEYELGALEPAVINHRGYTPVYVSHATLLTPGVDVAPVYLAMPPDCLEPEAYDRAGHITALPPLCLASEMDVNVVADDGFRARRGACSLSAPGSSPAPGWPALAPLALGIALRLRRRPTRFRVSQNLGTGPR